MKSGDLQSVFPALYANAMKLHDYILPIAVAIVIIGLSLKVWRGSFGDVSEMLRGILTAAIIAFIIPLFPDWTNQLQLVGYRITEEIGADPTQTNQRYASLLLGGAQDADKKLGIWDLLSSGDVSIGEVISYANVNLASQFAMAVNYLFFWIQQILLIYGIATAPVFIAFFIVDSMRGVARQYLLRLVSVALWPMGWAIANVLTQGLLDKSVGGEATPFGASQSFFLIIVVTLWILFSTIAAPLMISKMLTQGMNAGSVLLKGLASSVGQGVTYAVGGGVAAHMMGAGVAGITASAGASGFAGYTSGAMGSSSMIVPSAIGLGIGMASNRTQPKGNYNSKAQQIYKDSQ